MYDEVRSYLEFQELQRMKGSLTISGVRFCSILESWLDAGHYKRHWDGLHGVWVECDSFREFMEVSPPRGLGLGLAAKHEITILERGGVPAASRVLAAWYKGQPMPKHGEIGNGRESRGDIITSTERGTGTTYTLRRLARDAPELLDRIEAGELTVNQAAIEAGIRKKLSNAEKAVRAFRLTENRLEPMRAMLDLLEPSELEVIRDWVVQRLD